MSKLKTNFECSSCNYLLPKWQGCCPSCEAWNTINEKAAVSTAKNITSARSRTMQQLGEHQALPLDKIKSNFGEWDRVFGGGVVPGSLNILTGDPGIGKSTLLLQIAHHLAQNYRVCYFSSEESLNQVADRAQRIIGKHSPLLFLSENNLSTIIETIRTEQPALAIIDSIQNCFLDQSSSSNGSINQLREAGFALMQLAKETQISIILTAHITKEGELAGPKTLEHLVDAVFYLQGEDQWQIRVLRALKNRFGAINELGFFEMQSDGMQQIPNINQLLLEHRSAAPGASLISYIEGTRPLLLELQALTIPTKLTMPQRVITGLDHKHVVLIAAILEKYLKIKFSNHDIFFKVSGNFKIKTQAADLGIALALLSSYFQQALPEKTIALGELSLTGQVKPVSQINLHLKEAMRFGLKQIIIPADLKKITVDPGVQITAISNVYELLSLFELK
jgi:DNA repair protein RadA/Sms